MPAGAKVDGDVNLSLGIGVDSRSSNVKRVEVHSDYQKPHKRPAAVESLRGHGRKGRDEIMSEINATYVTKYDVSVRECAIQYYLHFVFGSVHALFVPRWQQSGNCCTATQDDQRGGSIEGQATTAA